MGSLFVGATRPLCRYPLGGRAASAAFHFTVTGAHINTGGTSPGRPGGHLRWPQHRPHALARVPPHHIASCRAASKTLGPGGGGAAEEPPPTVDISSRLKALQSARVVYGSAASIGHAQEGHPESNERVPAILRALEDANLTPRARGPEVMELTGVRPARASQVAAVHTPAYVRGLEKVMERAADEGLIYVDGSGPTFATPTTYTDCLQAAGTGLAVVDCVVAASEAYGKAPAGFALVRPPGHHAVAAGPMGFCLVDHIAVAARHCQLRHGLQRVLIVDFDVHHGNGTNDIFFHDPDVLFLSTHQKGSYPGTGRMEEVGEGPGEGYTINLPLPGGAGDAAMAATMEHVIAPAALRFRPDVILVSAGYDAHYEDPLAGLQFTTGTYYRLTKGIQELAQQLCQGRVVFFLEGGYNLRSLSNSVADSFRALLGEGSLSSQLDDPLVLYEEPENSVKDAITQLRSLHSL